jgi:hypothetical protein
MLCRPGPQHYYLLPLRDKIYSKTIEQQKYAGRGQHQQQDKDTTTTLGSTGS